jgi:uncharacterized repeat protein (TIGR01451 family)
VLIKRPCPNASLVQSLIKVIAFALSFWLLIASQQAGAVYINRYTTTTNGAITFVGNTLGLDGSNTVNSPGLNGSIGAFTTTNTSLRATAVAPNTSFPFGTTTDWTLNGSAANFTLPPGSTILYAELIWGGSYSFGGQNVSASLGNSVSFKTPAGTYSVAPAAATSQTQGVPDGAGNCTTLYCRYVRSANVTGLVQIGQSGNYEVGGVPATANSSEPNNHAAGWTLAIVYSNPAQPPRNLTVFVGAEFGGASPTGVSGFCTNLVGPVKGRLLVSALEGDTRIVGDQMLFGPNTGAMTPLSGPNNPVSNFFGGQINGDLGSLNLTGTFGTLNHNLPAGTAIAGSRQGYDITNVDASGSLVNSQTSAFAQGTTTGDQYTINALGIQIDVGAPKFPLTVKSADRTITYVGDIVTYSIALDNTTGTANATNLMFFDTPPPGMSFVPGSVTLNGVSLPSANPVTGAAVGTINAGSVSTVTFKVQVNAIPASPAPAQYINRAKWTYDFISCAGFPSEAGMVETNTNTILAMRLEPTKTVLPTGAVGVGQVLTYTINVPNTGAANSVGTTLTDLIPVGTTYVAGSTTLNGALVPDVGGNMPFTTGALINSPTLAAGVVGAGSSAVIRFQVQVNPSPPAIITNTASIDLDGAGPANPIAVSAVNTPLSPPAATKLFVPSTIAANTPSVLTIQISNTNAQAFTLLALSDTLPAGVVIANPANAITTCGGGTAVATPGGITLGLSGASVGAFANCTVSANVTSALPGIYTNIIPAGGVTTTNAGNNVAPATAQLTVLQGPTINKSFSPSSIAPGGTATLTISVVNPTPAVILNANLTDIFPAGVVVASAPLASSNCAGTFAPAAGASSVSLVNGTVANANVCTMTVNVTSSAIGNYNNIIPAGALSSSGGTNATAASADLAVTSPSISKSFTPAVVGSNVNSVLTIVLNNPTNIAATGVTFTDTFPTLPGALTLANTTVANTCGGTVFDQSGGALVTGSAGVRLTSGVIPAGSSCSLRFNVRASVGGTYVNTIPAAGLITTNSGNSTAATSATLSVGLPGVEKTFGTFATPVPTVALGSNVRMSIRLSNANSAALAITSLIDNLPSGMLVANATTTSDCGGTVTDAAGGTLGAGDTGVRLNGGSIPASGSCTFTFNVTSNTAATYINTIPAGALITASGSNAFAANATINVLARPTISKTFSPVTISPFGTSVLTITLTNPNGETLTTAAFSDTFPTTPGAMTLANTAITNTCGGTLTQANNNALAVGSASIKLASGTIPGNGTCQVVANVTASVAGSYTNTIPVGGLTTNNGGASTVAAIANLNVAVLPPNISKAFAASPVGRSVPTRLTFTVNNPNAALALTGVAFTDVLPTIPGAMVVAPVPNVLISGCGATPVFSPSAGAASINFSGGNVAVGSTCQVSVDVVATIAGTYNNTSGAVSSTNAGTGGVATASLRVLSPPFVAKSFLPTPISVGGTSTLSLTISNPNANDVLTGVAVTDVYPAGLLNSAAPNPQINCGAGSSVAFTGGVANGNNVGLTSGSLAPGSYCTVTVNAVASAVGNIDNTTLAVASTNAGVGNTAFARLVVGVDITGFVYADANTNNAKDSVEAGTGLTLFVKLIGAGVVQQVASVNSTTGGYSFVAVPAGAYNVIVDTNNSLTDLTPNIAPGWVGTEAPMYNRAVSVGTTNVMNLNFGLNSGTRVSGRVFQDNGIANGIANDGVLNGGEIGIAATTVRLTNCLSTTYLTTSTDGAGNYTFNLASTIASGTTLCVTQTPPSGFIETGASLGSTLAASGSYSRATSTITFTHTSSVMQTGVNFGNVPVNTLTTDGLQTALPGTAVNYTHAFVAGSAGLVSFSTGAVASPAVVGWSEVIYRDTNCNGQIDTGEPTVGAAIAVNAGDQICLVVRQFVPGGAAIGAQNLVTLTANFSYTNASPLLAALLSRTDTTIVGTPTSSGLRLVKSVNLATALPGSILTYTITYRNDSTGPLSTLSINDTTPAFTSFVIANCGAIPANLTSCTVSTAPTVGGVGPIAWTFVGTLAPAAQGTVTFSVQVNN